VQVQNRTGWDCGLGFRLLAVERGGDEHSDAHQAGILHLNTHLSGTEAGIENGKNVVDATLEDPVGIGIETDVGRVADAHRVEIIFVNVADNPDVGQVGDGEGIRRP